MQPRLIQTASLWGGLICVLLALVALFHGWLQQSLLFGGGAVLLLGWGAWGARG